MFYLDPLFPQFSLNTAHLTNFPDQLSLRKTGAKPLQGYRYFEQFFMNVYIGIFVLHVIFSPFFIKYMNISISEIHTFEYKRSSIPYWLISIELQFKQWWKLLVLFDKFTLFVFTCAGIIVKVFLSANLIANTRFSVAVCTF